MRLIIYMLVSAGILSCVSSQPSRSIANESKSAFSKVALSFNLMCGLKKDRSLHCFCLPEVGKSYNENEIDQLSLSSCKLQKSSDFSKMSQLREILDIAVSGRTICAIDEKQGLTCAHVFSSADEKTPYIDQPNIDNPSEDLDDAVSIVGGAPGFCALNSSGDPICWGSRTITALPAEIKNVSKIYLSSDYACALIENNSWLSWDQNHIKCWRYGSLYNPTVSRERFLRNVEAVAFSDSRICALNSSKELKCTVGETTAGPFNAYFENVKKSVVSQLDISSLSDDNLSIGLLQFCSTKKDKSAGCWRIETLAKQYTAPKKMPLDTPTLAVKSFVSGPGTTCMIDDKLGLICHRFR